jgi:aminopeptidase N
MKYTVSLLLMLIASNCKAQSFTSADTLRGSIGEHRAWWNVIHYDIAIDVNSKSQNLRGTTKIKFVTTQAITDANKLKMQIDLDSRLEMSKIYLEHDASNLLNSKMISDRANFVSGFRKLLDTNILVIEYSGKPLVAKNAPWDGGLTWDTDKEGRPWISVSCQGLGASVWYPCKDHQSDEPELGATMRITCPKEVMAVSNGRLLDNTTEDSTRTCVWQVVNPINNYNISFYIGAYKSISAKYKGVKGELDYTFWYLDYNEKKAKKLHSEIPAVLQSFEYWFGAFPWYADGYQLVEAPYLGMEHQSAIAYGNKYKRGYSGMDMTFTGIGLKFDYILVHESGHEWFGNNITAADIADMWLQEGFTTHSEALYVESTQGKEKGEKYIRAQRKLIQNEAPIIGIHGVNSQPSEDQYYKGSQVLLMIRTAINNDTVYRDLLHHIQKTFALKPCTSAQVEKEISKFTGINFQPMFDQFLYTNEIPKLDIKREGKDLVFTLSDCNDGFEILYNINDGKQAHCITLKAGQQHRLQTEIDAKAAKNENYYFR